jgi:hypothetical protein
MLKAMTVSLQLGQHEVDDLVTQARRAVLTG